MCKNDKVEHRIQIFRKDAFKEVMVYNGDCKGNTFSEQKYEDDEFIGH